MSKLTEAISYIESLINPNDTYLPEELFLFLSRIRPVTNVDILIKDDENRILLTWRDDEFFGPGWHVPGSVIRYKEKGETRAILTAWSELGVDVEVDPKPIMLLENIIPEKTDRAHFIAILYKCKLLMPLSNHNRFNPNNPINGAWEWHSSFPENMIKEHLDYKILFEGDI